MHMRGRTLHKVKCAFESTTFGIDSVNCRCEVTLQECTHDTFILELLHEDTLLAASRQQALCLKAGDERVSAGQLFACSEAALDSQGSRNVLRLVPLLLTSRPPGPAPRWRPASG